MGSGRYEDAECLLLNSKENRTGRNTLKLQQGIYRVNNYNVASSIKVGTLELIQELVEFPFLCICKREKAISLEVEKINDHLPFTSQVMPRIPEAGEV